MKPTHSIAAAAPALILAILLAVPAWLGAVEPAGDATTPEQQPRRGYLGVGLEELTPELQTHFGAPEGSGILVASVSDDGPAAAAGIRVGDVITAVDGLAVESIRDLSREIRHRPGAPVSIELYRDGARQQVTATLGERQTHGWDHDGGRSPEAWGEHWERWGEEFGERMGRWGEEFGQRFGEEFAQRWGEEHSAEWQRWAEAMAERGEGWEEMGEEIGRTVEKALSEVDWEEIGKSVEQSMKALEGIDWEGMSADIERRMEEMERRLEERRQ